jgi:hypothetical protein
MRPPLTSCRFATGVLLLLLTACAAPLAAQTRRVDSGSASLPTFAFYWETRLAPPAPPLSNAFSALYAVSQPNEVHRILMDGERRVYFGYTVRVETTALPARFRLSFRPLSLTPDLEQRFNIDATWKPLPAPRFPGIADVRSGEVLELSLLTNEAWGQHLTEYVAVQEPTRSPGFETFDRTRELVVAPGTPRDFTVSDALLHLREPRIFTNGRLQESSNRLLVDETGSIVWVYVPNRGRFLLSLTPLTRFGFKRAGEIRGSSLRFTVGADTYSVSCSRRIAPGDAAFNLYVLHQPGWRPNYPNADLGATIVGAADAVEDALK